MTDNLIPRPTGETTASQQVAARLRAAMAAKKLSAVEVARRMRDPWGLASDTVSSRWVQRRATGEMDLTLNDVQWLALALDVPMGDLLADVTQPTT
jgi:transcriptional regulator with XRE-family HTH domain